MRSSAMGRCTDEHGASQLCRQQHKDELSHGSGYFLRDAVDVSSGHLSLGQETSEGETLLAGVGRTEMPQLCDADVSRDKFYGITVKLWC